MHPVQGQEGDFWTDIPNSQIRRVTAKRLLEAKQVRYIGCTLWPPLPQPLFQIAAVSVVMNSAYCWVDDCCMTAADRSPSAE